MLEEDKDFDLKIRSILEDGREEVPDYLWEAVQKRLPAKKTRPVVIWRRTATAVAAAAAAVAAFLLGPDLFISTQHNAEPYMDLSADAGIQVVGNTSAETEDQQSTYRETLAEAMPDLTDKPASGTTAARTATSASPTEAVSESEASAHETVPQSVIEDMPETMPLLTDGSATSDLSTNTEKTGNAVSPEKTEGKDRRSGHEDTSISDALWDDSEVLDADADAAKRKTPVAMTFSGNAISNSTQGKSVRSPAPMQSSGIPPANSLHEEMATSYGIPLSFGAGVKIFFNKRWALGAGINYSLLNRTLSGIYYDENSIPFSDSDILNSQSYIGIPVNVYFSILKKDFIDLYAYAGGSVEKCVSSTYLIDAPGHTLTYREKSHGVQLSADIGIGVEFLVIDRLGIYIDPSLRYYFKSRQPQSIRTVQPLMLGFEAGLRVRL